MTKINDGGPAFPVCTAYVALGMSLRDYLAAHIDLNKVDFPSFEEAAKFTGLTLPDDKNFSEMLRFSFDVQARLKYMAADAMLKAREVKP